MSDELKHFEKISHLIDSMGITEPPKTSFEFGVEAERERIIKLLEEWRDGLLSLYDLPNVVISVRSIDGLIEIIKGETNE
jgi:hypothetical protein